MNNLRIILRIIFYSPSSVTKIKADKSLGKIAALGLSSVLVSPMALDNNESISSIP